MCIQRFTKVAVIFFTIQQNNEYKSKGAKMNDQEHRYTNQTPPVLLLTFSRPDQAARVLERIKGARPRVLYVACDGPRSGRTDDVANVNAIHTMIDQIDWCANVKTLFRDINLGCGRAVSEAITWFLADADEGIILEDDCLPDPSFFPFCAEMLDRYRNTTNVMQIAGYNLLSGKYDPGSDFFFSQFGWQWGWATWKRAWDNFDLKMTSWPEFKKRGFHHVPPFCFLRTSVFDRTYAGKIGTWDFQWAYAVMTNSGLSIVPRYSLTENIGFGAGATHGTNVQAGIRFRVTVRSVVFPLKQSQFLYSDPLYDRMLVKAAGPQTVRGKLGIYMARLRSRFFH
jgi:hypothetical protein